MIIKKRDIPNESDLVMCTITKVFSHGAFARLDEYQGKDGFVHISEVASTWIKNIRDFVREGQKTVAKVLNVDRAKGHIDLSVRRVSDAQRKNKIQDWKRAQKSEKLLEIAGKEIDKTLQQAYEEAGFALEEKYGEIYSAFEEMVSSGTETFNDTDISKEWKKPLLKVAKENVVLPSVNITGYLGLKCLLPNGVDVIKESLILARDTGYGEDVKVDIKYIKSPRFSINVTAPDYREAEEALKRCADITLEHIQKLGGTGTFKREQK
ncbi:MAG: translation initiation factor IF-2 subunit alpha [Candidatus Hydrothermarchaeaceae archaeon]